MRYLKLHDWQDDRTDRDEAEAAVRTIPFPIEARLAGAADHASFAISEADRMLDDIRRQVDRLTGLLEEEIAIPGPFKFPGALFDGDDRPTAA